MNKYDCSKALDFEHELKRMCDSFQACPECPLKFVDCSIDNVTQEHIDTVQKWSDEHPEDDITSTKMFFVFNEQLNHAIAIDLTEWNGNVDVAYQLAKLTMSPSDFESREEDFKLWLIGCWGMKMLIEGKGKINAYQV